MGFQVKRSTTLQDLANAKNAVSINGVSVGKFGTGQDSIGYGTTNTTATSVNSVAVGTLAANSMTDGNNVSALGYGAGYSNTPGQTGPPLGIRLGI